MSKHLILVYKSYASVPAAEAMPADNWHRYLAIRHRPNQVKPPQRPGWSNSNRITLRTCGLRLPKGWKAV